MIVSPILPYRDIPHAGGVYLRHLNSALVKAGYEVVFLVAAEPNATEAVGRPGAPEQVIVLGSARRRSFGRRALMRAAYVADGWLRRWDPTWPPIALTVQLVTSPEARQALRAADVIDVHFPEYSRLVPLLRRVNPRARIVTTLHDVLSQRISRSTELATRPGRLLSRALASAERLELATWRRSDIIIVFSDKDRMLLTDRPRPASPGLPLVISPPLAGGPGTTRRPNRQQPVVCFVSLLARGENEDAALWLLQDIWPLVIQAVPTARLALAGRGASMHVVQAAARATNVDLRGFVADLDEFYATASACIVPLRLGAGVKFKSVEALLAGVPTVTTAVGAEGIAGPDRFVEVSDNAVVLAQSLIEVLLHPDEAEAAAADSQAWARDRYSIDTFERQVRGIYRSLSAP